LFHTGEGGALFTSNEALQHQLFYSHNFGHNGPLDFFGVGINAKMSELQAAMGLTILPHMEEIVSQRKEVVDYYNDNLDFSKLKTMTIREHTKWNYSYYPVIFESEAQLLQAQKVLNESQIFPRRYFYPSLNTVEYYNGIEKPMPVSEKIAASILCLPLYAGLTKEEMKMVVNKLNSAL
jgi:dTDP-4-amino-4,6-dideoxygalactose transaminase